MSNTCINSLTVFDRWRLQGSVVPTHVSMAANVQRLETRYVSVHWASKERGASMVSFL